MLEVDSEIRNGSIDVDLILPFEFGPHASELAFRAVRGVDVIQDIDVHVIQNDIVAIARSWTVVEDIAEDDACFRRGHFDSGFNALEGVRSERVLKRSLDKLQVAQSSELDRHVLQRF
jgi:hypothetical protein